MRELKNQLKVIKVLFSWGNIGAVNKKKKIRVLMKTISCVKNALIVFHIRFKIRYQILKKKKLKKASIEIFSSL